MKYIISFFSLIIFNFPLNKMDRFQSQVDKDLCSVSVENFYFYRKYENNLQTNKILICAAYNRDSSKISLRPTDKSGSEYLPRFLSSYYMVFEDSVIYKDYGKGYKEELIKLDCAVGDTLFSNTSKVGWITQSTGLNKDSLRYYKMYVEEKEFKEEFMYIHNLGFISDRRIYKDSIVEWKLEKINGYPIQTYYTKEYKFLLRRFFWQ